MKQYTTDKLRNVCLVAHGNAGKTSLAEAMLYNTGAIDRLGRVLDGNATMDFDPEEIKRKVSISAATAYLEYRDLKINLIDTPGYFDFVGEVMEGLRVADCAVVVASGKSGISVGTENVWKYASRRNLPKILFINKLDEENADFLKVLEQARQIFGSAVLPFFFPIKEDGKVIGAVDIMHMKGLRFDGPSKTSEIPVPDDLTDVCAKMKELIAEAVAESTETLMEKYFAGEEFTDEEVKEGIRSGVLDGSVVPALGGSATENFGVCELLDIIADYMPSPIEAPKETLDTDGGETVLAPDASGPLAALVFKTVADPYVGRMSYFRVMSGTMKADSAVLNPVTGQQEKIGRLFVMRGKKQEETPQLCAGDIGVVTKLVKTYTGDTLCAPGAKIKLQGIDFPAPCLSMAIQPKAKGDEEKIGQGLQKLMEEDPTFRVETNNETKQTILSGVGEQHLEIIIGKLKAKFGVEAVLSEPKNAYRESIRKKVKVEGKHKKQSGGHGQYGHVWIEFEPGESEDLVFEEKVFGGAVPKNYFPAVEKGLRECTAHGVLAGYPVVNLKATLVDGSYHPVDSSEMAFKIAASIAYKKGLESASPVLLEPIGHLEVIVPDAQMGDIIGDINKRRGRILGMNPQEGGLQQIVAEVPVAEMSKYATDLRSMSQGRGSFTFAFERYEEAPANVAQKVIEDSGFEMKIEE